MLAAAQIARSPSATAPRSGPSAARGSGGQATHSGAAGQGETPEAWLSRVVGVGSMLARHIIDFFEYFDVRTLDKVKTELERASENEALLKALLWADDIDENISRYASARIKNFYRSESPGRARPLTSDGDDVQRGWAGAARWPLTGRPGRPAACRPACQGTPPADRPHNSTHSDPSAAHPAPQWAEQGTSVHHRGGAPSGPNPRAQLSATASAEPRTTCMPTKSST